MRDHRGFKQMTWRSEGRRVSVTITLSNSSRGVSVMQSRRMSSRRPSSGTWLISRELKKVEGRKQFWMLIRLQPRRLHALKRTDG